MLIPVCDKERVQSLARRLAEIAALPVQQEKRGLWLAVNRLQRVRPPFHVQALDWNIWEELVPQASLRCTDPLCRGQEFELRKRIYAFEEFGDDRVEDGVIGCPIAIAGDSWATCFGVGRKVERTHDASGAYAFVPLIVEEADLEKIQPRPVVTVDWADTERRCQQLEDLYGGALPVETRGRSFFWFYPIDQFIVWRGIEQTLVDLLERPAWIHACLERITQGYLSTIEQMEALGVLAPGNANTMLGSGGYAWTDELPQPGFDGRHVRLRDLWARAATQIFTDGISPAMHEEFAVRYEKRLLERFGLSCYGCCEPLDAKMDIVRTIGNLRRVSMSPWVNLERAAAAVGRDYVYTHKPNPSIVSMESWHPDLARSQLREALEKTRNNVVEINLQDLHTVRGEPRRLREGSRIARELAEEYA